MAKLVLNPRIVADLFDGDFILANLDTGIYYSLSGLAVYLVSKLPSENINALVDEIAGLFPGQESKVRDDLTLVLGKLEKEEIIVTIEKDDVRRESFQVEKPVRFTTSKLSKYADMQDLLMLDPIHQVDEDGWPQEVVDDREQFFE